MEFLIVGLGNPGGKYEKTRHNVGRDIVKDFALENNFPDWRYDKYADALRSDTVIDGNEIKLLLPETYMNNSGKSVFYIKEKYKIDTENIIVVHDDLDLSLGQIKLQLNRGTGGHNGLKDIAGRLKTKKFNRLKFGIVPIDESGVQRKPKGEKQVLNFVLKKFSSGETELVEKTKRKAVDALYVFLTKGLETAMNEFN